MTDSDTSLPNSSAATETPCSHIPSATGLSIDSLTLYQFLAGRGACAVESAAREIGWSETTTREVLAELLDAGLVELDADTVIRMDDPWNALGRLVREEHRQLERSETVLGRIRQTRLKVLKALPQLTAMKDACLQVEIVQDPALTVLRLLEGASVGVRMMDTSRAGRPYLVEDLTARIRPLTEEGIDISAIILAGRRDQLGPDVALSGARLRVATALPFSLLIIDDRVAVCELDLRAGHACVLLTRSLPLVGLLDAIFEREWAAAEAYCPASGRTRSPQPETGLDRRERVILRMLADGMKDEAIARNLGISVRTLRRAITRIQDRLQTRNRLETVAVAARDGLLP